MTKYTFLYKKPVFRNLELESLKTSFKRNYIFYHSWNFDYFVCNFRNVRYVRYYLRNVRYYLLYLNFYGSIPVDAKMLCFKQKQTNKQTNKQTKLSKKVQNLRNLWNWNPCLVSYKKTCKKTHSEIEITGSKGKFFSIYFCFAFVKTRRP